MLIRTNEEQSKIMSLRLDIVFNFIYIRFIILLLGKPQKEALLQEPLFEISDYSWSEGRLSLE